MKTIKTWLPIFPGFYGSVYEPDESNEIEGIFDLRADNKLTAIDTDAIQFDYKEYHKNVVIDCCAYFEREMQTYLDKVIFEGIRSPREYNFSNDAVDIEVSLSAKKMKVISKYLNDNKEEFAKWIKERYTSCSGFMSHYSNEVELWLLPDCLQHEHKLGQILQFIAYQTIENVEDDMYYYATQDNYLEASNYTECTEMEYCASCNEFYKPELRKGNLCPECFEQGRKNLDIIVCAKCGEEITNKRFVRSFTHQLKHGLIKSDQVFCSDHNV